jgi:hypothetical protein
MRAVLLVLYPFLRRPALPAPSSATLAASVAGTGARRRSLPFRAIQPAHTGRRRSICVVIRISRTNFGVDLGAARTGPNRRAREALPTLGLVWGSATFVFAHGGRDSAQHVIVLYGPGIKARSSVVPRQWRRRRTERLDDEGEDLGDGRTVKPVLVVIENVLIRHAHMVVHNGDLGKGPIVVS